MPALGVPLDAADGAIAAALVAGLVIDTANFQHPNTTPRTLRVAAELVAAGAPLYDTARRLYRTKPNRQLRLFGRVMAEMGTDLEGRLVWATLTTPTWPRQVRARPMPKACLTCSANLRRARS